MKKLNTLLLLFSCSSLLWAQTNTKCIEWVKDETPATDFSATYTIGSDFILYNILQPAKEYNPIGLRFISSDKTEDQAVIDMSYSAKVSFTLENTSTIPVEVKVHLEDINGIKIAYDKEVIDNNDMSELYKYEIGATSTNHYGTEAGKVAVDKSIDFSYDFSNAIAADFDFNPNITENPYGCNNKPTLLCTDGLCFDYSKVKKVCITIVNNTAFNETECYDKEAFNGTVKISDMKVYGQFYGDYYGPYLFNYWEECDKILSSNNDLKNNYALEVYPNPATEAVQFSKMLNIVQVYNAQGSLVETLGSANALNVSSYEAGVYFIKATEGTSRVVVK